MPNWCHCTLTVSGEADELQRFIEAARIREEDVRPEYETHWDVPEWIADEKREEYLNRLGPKVSFEEFFARCLENQPLSFHSLCPQPPDEELRKLERHKPCTMCGARGRLPRNPVQAEKNGAKWYDWMDPKVRKDRTCNACGGTKEERVGMEGWYEWRVRHWGTKWDASFTGSSLFALGNGEEIDVDLSLESRGATVTPTVVIYKFDTAWAPPSPVIAAASEQHPELEFVLQFGEVGGDFAGWEKYVSGICVDNEELEVEEVLAPEEMWF